MPVLDGTRPIHALVVFERALLLKVLAAALAFVLGESVAPVQVLSEKESDELSHLIGELQGLLHAMHLVPTWATAGSLVPELLGESFVIGASKLLVVFGDCLGTLLTLGWIPLATLFIIVAVTRTSLALAFLPGHRFGRPFDARSGVGGSCRSPGWRSSLRVTSCPLEGIEMFVKAWLDESHQSLDQLGPSLVDASLDVGVCLR